MDIRYYKSWGIWLEIRLTYYSDYLIKNSKGYIIY